MTGRAIVVGVVLAMTPSIALFAIMLWRVRPHRADRRRKADASDGQDKDAKWSATTRR